MLKPFPFAVAVLCAFAVLAPLSSTTEAGTKSRERVAVRLLPPGDGDASGRLELTVQSRGDKVREGFRLLVEGLDATRDDAGDLPSYHLVLLTADVETEADFGEVFLNGRGNAKLKFNAARSDFPEGVESLTDLGGGTAELRLGDEVILTGEIPEFLSVEDENEPGSGARAVVVSRERLKPIDRDLRARGSVEAKYGTRPRGDVETVRVKYEGLGRDGDLFEVYLVDEDGNEDLLGTVESRSRDAVGVLFLSSSKEDDIPGDSVLDLGGRTVEIRDGDGTMQLRGTFPTLRD